MLIDTTLYIHKSTWDLIRDAAVLSGNKPSRVIKMLLQRVMGDPKKVIRTGSAIRYQERDQKGNWHTVHVRFREDEADYFKDMRNFLKLSVSLILARAARDYLQDVISEMKRCLKSDNYRFSNYILSYEELDGYIFWKICWGYPPRPEKYFRL